MLRNIYYYYHPATVQVVGACGRAHHFSVGVTIIIDNEHIIKSNNLGLFKYGIKVRLGSTKSKLIKLPPTLKN